MSEFEPIPPWLSNENFVAPCPCGMPMMGAIAVIESDNGLATGYHYPHCMGLRKIHEELEHDDNDDIEWRNE